MTTLAHLCATRGSWRWTRVVALGRRDHECRHTAPATSRAARALPVARAPVEVNATTLAAARFCSAFFWQSGLLLASARRRASER
eukprot:scaffold16433_cov82-Phaeocystis_antarctica.AAC.1